MWFIWTWSPVDILPSFRTTPERPQNNKKNKQKNKKKYKCHWQSWEAGTSVALCVTVPTVVSVLCWQTDVIVEPAEAWGSEKERAREGDWQCERKEVMGKGGKGGTGMEKVFRVTGYQKKDRDMRRESTEVTVVSLLMAVLHIYFTLFLSFFGGYRHIP